MRAAQSPGSDLDPGGRHKPSGSLDPHNRNLLAIASKTYARHGVPDDRYGVSIADLKIIAKKIKGKQTLACDLYETGNFGAMYLAGIVAKGSQMTKKQLESWAKNSTCGVLSEYPIAWVATESPHARDLSLK